MTSPTNSSPAHDRGEFIRELAGGLRLFTGKPHPLGATPDADGVHFTLYSHHATAVQLLLFRKPGDPAPTITIDLPAREHKAFHFWHCYVEGLRPGTGYAYRVDGPWDIRAGHRFDARKVLLDPYARGVCLDRWDREAARHPGDNLSSSLRGVILETDSYDWEGDQPLGRPMAETIIYEMHVGGFTKSPASGVAAPGTYAGVIEKIPYLQKLGVTAVELLPVFTFDGRSTLRHNPEGEPLRNYWGYGPVGWFALQPDYASRPDAATALDEFRDMVKALHRAGIEVILDVVFNHTDEGNEEGPTFSFKGLDNQTYYYLEGPEGSLEGYADYSGCGNTFNCNHPIGAKLILDCLRFWVREMHVDGFRFDEGSILSRGEDGTPLRHPPVVWAVELSESLADSKVIAEAWDAAGLYQVGHFPGGRWAEWNGRFRDVVRSAVKSDPGRIGELAGRLAGSADLYEWEEHQPVNSVNFLTAHDGFTLHDLTAYNDKHNEANGEDDRDGANDNLSWNCGTEGPTADPAILALRERQQKNFACLLLLSLGVPMITAGDEVARTQQGNNNAYCQDSPVSWFDWERAAEHADLFRFWSHLIRFRHEFLDHFRGRYFTGGINRFGVPEISWHGTRLHDPGWDDPNARCLAFTLGDLDEPNGEERNLHLLLNFFWEPLRFDIPVYEGLTWHRRIDTSLPAPEDIVSGEEATTLHQASYTAAPRSLVVLASRA